MGFSEGFLEGILGREALEGHRIGKRGGAQKSMGHKVPWKIGMLICHPVTARPLIFLQKEAILSPCKLRDHPFAILHSEVLSPLNFATHEMEDPFAARQFDSETSKRHLKRQQP